MEDGALAAEAASTDWECEAADSLGAGGGRASVPLSQRLAFALFPLSLAAILTAVALWTSELGLLPGWLPVIVFGAVLAVVASILLWREMVRTCRTEALRARVQALEEQKRIAAAYHESIAKDEGRILATRREVAEEVRQALAMVRDRNEAAAFGSLDRALELMGDAAYRQCDHRTVDAIATIKRRACEEAGVEPRFALEIPRDIPLSPVDLCAVVGNLADNGLAGALRYRDEQTDATDAPIGEDDAAGSSQRPASRRPFLELHSAVEGAYLVVSAKSPLSAADEASFGARRSSLSQRRATLDDAHGWGLSIVEAIAKRHNGWFGAEASEGVFCARVVLELDEAMR